MTSRMRAALVHLERAASEGSDPHGSVASCPTIYDQEIQTAFVHWKTAGALEARGLIRFGDWEPEYGTDIYLVLRDERPATSSEDTA